MLLSCVGLGNKAIEAQLASGACNRNVLLRDRDALSGTYRAL